MKKLRRHARALVWLAPWLVACEAPGGDALARLGAETVTAADLDAYLLAQPQAAREVPAGDEAGWMEDKLRRLALERVLAAEAEELASTPEGPAQRLLLRSRLLGSLLQRDLAREATPTAEEVETRADEMARRSRTEPLLDFQHVFLRTDRGDPKDARARARKVLAEVAAGADFPDLARRYSDSADAATGGLVRNAKPSDLDEAPRSALAALAEGEVSPVVESRTGLHVFRLVRRVHPDPPARSQLVAGARQALTSEGIAALQTEILEAWRQRSETGAGGPWRLGETVIEAEVVERLVRGAGPQSARALVDQLLLAEEAKARGLESADVAGRIDADTRLALLDRVFNQRRRELDERLGEDVLEAYYDAQPSLFDTLEKTRVELVFVRQGGDSFATQRRLEARVEELRAGADFAALAREISSHESAPGGGDLGFLAEHELGAYCSALPAAVAELAVGEVSDPVYCTGRVLSHDPRLLRGGFAVLRVAERSPARSRSFEEAREEVRRVYAAQHRAELDNQLRDEILAAAGFEILRLPEPSELAL